MKKRGAILGLLVISVLLISISFASAQNETNETDACLGIPISRWCPDETTLCPMTTDEQGCSVWDCDSCEPEPPEPGEEICCKITSVALGMTGAKIEYEQIIESECPPSELLDGTSYEIVSDKYCEDSPPDDRECEEGDEKYYECPDGTKVPNCECESNMWVCKIFKDENCPNDGPEPGTCAGQIKVTFNKGSYQLGDPVKIIIEIFDSEGNHLPNYAFYGQMYDNMWHSAGLEKTDNKGYFINTGIAEKPAGGVTEVKFKVYTKETSSCGSVEDTAEVKFEPGECGLGECEPDPRCKDKVRMCGGKCTPCPEDDDDGEIFYPCRGCELENKCYPYGYRKAENYCLDENNVFVNQLADNEKCENNFECKTNLCINGNCVSSNLWNKILEWFKKIFGGGDDEEKPKECSKLLIEKNIGDNEYNQTLYGVSEETQAPLFTDDCEQIGKIKCCVAQYSENGNSGMALMCPYDDRGDVENLVRCGRKAGDFLGEYKGEKVIKMDQERVIVWTYENYALAVGKMPEKGIPEEVADAYLKKYKNDLGEIEVGDIPPPRPPNSVELCGEIEDSIEEADCFIDVAISKSNAEICENIGDSEYRDKCYIHVAEHTGDASICDNVADSSLREKCYFWVAGETGEDDNCAGIIDVDLREMCYVEVAQKTGDASFCDKIADSHIGDKCYRDVGIQTDDKSLCEKIIEDQAKQKCLDNTS